MSGWERLLRPPLRGVGAYEPGPSLDELMTRHGLARVDKLNWNEGLWGPLPGVEDAVAAALDQIWAYPEHAYNALREAIAAESGARPEQIMPAHGIQALILTLVSAFAAQGGTVVVPEHTYGLYAQASRVAGANVALVPSPGLRLDLERVADEARRTGARLAWICDPNNPTGARVEPGEWRAFLDAVGPDCVVVADEAYVDYVEPGERIRREDDVDEGRHVVILRTFSKIYGLAGLRLGYAIADPVLLRYLHSVQEPFNVNRAALAAGLASLGRSGEVAQRRATVTAARDRFAAALARDGIRTLPSGGNFVLAEVGVDDVELTRSLEPRGVLIRPAHDMGLPGWVRVTIGPEEAMDRAAAAIGDVRGVLLAAGAVPA
ncbi:MAG: histidinol-phosphate aminotransferase family protein [Solirubrobacterales bacterium]|nr:histidinol-phosphate aminotransferase family protein [Solirubrobacterales bacterium]